MIKEIINRIIYPYRYSSEAFCKYLKDNGCKIGEGTHFFNPKTINIDMGRLEYISIGKNCKITQDVAILAHDYSWECLCLKYGEILPSGGKCVKIGNNVFIGQKATILRGVEIGDNCIIGAGSVVTKSLPANSVCAGNPAREISTLDDFYRKIKENQKKAALYEARVFYNSFNRIPNIEETGYFMITFLERNKENFDKYFKRLPFLGDRTEIIEKYFFNTKQIWNGYSEYRKYIIDNIKE